MENLQSKTPYNFKKSYGGTPEPLPPEYPPCRRGPSLKIDTFLFHNVTVAPNGFSIARVNLVRYGFSSLVRGNLTTGICQSSSYTI